MPLSRDDYANFGVGDAAEMMERPLDVWADDHEWEFDGKTITHAELLAALEQEEKTGEPLGW
jgi:hypothetical protein